MNNIKTLHGNIVDVVKRTIFQGKIEIENNVIKSITSCPTEQTHFIMPGFVDAHIHIESSMLIPSEFARIAVVHGTTACVSDPHELANVMGIDGVKFMINNGKKVPFRFYFGAPSCVPATGFETSGASIDSTEIETLLMMPEIKYLAEMMNFPGVIYNDAEVMKKIALAHQYMKVIDGHAPGLSGDALKKYAEAGITTDHECFTIAEAEEKIALGMKILIREGSAAKNFDELIPLIAKYPEHIMLCSDDKHPDDLIKGHINLLVKKSVELGYDIFDILRTVSYNPVKHYGLDAGLLQLGDKADFIVVDDLKNFNILETYIDGTAVAKSGQSYINKVEEAPVNVFNSDAMTEKDIALAPETNRIKVIKAIDGQLITKAYEAEAKVSNNNVISDTGNDILKIVVMQRYKKSKPAVAFINGFGLKKGAMASTIAHDSHNIIAVGVDDADIVNAINTLIEHKGGVAAVYGTEKNCLPLPFGGLMSAEDAAIVAEKYELIDHTVKQYGTALKAPFMTLAFMALLVIPELKLSDKGLFDGSKFAFTPLFV